MARLDLELSEEEFEQQYQILKEQKDQRRVSSPQARRAWYDAAANRLMVELHNDVLIGFPCSGMPELRDAAPESLAGVTLSAYGDALFWLELDVHINLLGLLAETLQTNHWAARFLGQKGGSAKSEVKTRAVRENGKKGGRPKGRKTA